MCKKNSSLNIALKILDKKNISPNYINWLRDKDINKYLEARFNNYNEDELKQYIQSCNKDSNILLFGIFANDIHIGNIKLDINPHHKFAYLGILIGEKSFHKKGIGKKAISNMLEKAKSEKINTILAGMCANNIESMNLFKSMGFTKCGLFTKHYLFNGKYIDKVTWEYIL